MIDKYSEKIENWKKELFKDPLIQILLDKSHLTKIQLDTYLLDVFADEIIGKKLKYIEKARIRKKGKKISRGAFNRSLNQAKKNIIKSINTIFLLGYLGLFDSPNLEPFIEISKKLSRYIKIYKKIWNKQNNKDMEEIILFKKDLEEKIKNIF